jgi:hypothetical protein
MTPVLFIDASRRSTRTILATPPAPWRYSPPGNDSRALRPLPGEEPRLHSFGGLYFHYVMSSFSLCAMHFLSQTGFLYWDRSRLSARGIPDPLHFELVLQAFTSHQSRDTSLLKESIAQPEIKKAKSIIRWTRCPVQCSFEEWSGQPIKVSSSREESGAAQHKTLSPQQHNKNIRGWCGRSP